MIPWVRILREESSMPPRLCGLFIMPQKEEMWDWCTVLYRHSFGSSLSYASAFLKGAAVSMQHINADLKRVFLRIILFSGTEQLTQHSGIPSPIKLSQCLRCRANICVHYKRLLSQQILLHYHTVVQQQCRFRHKRKQNHVSLHEVRVQASLWGGVSTMKPLLNFDGIHSYISTHRDLSFPPQIAGEL